jgi:nucleoside-diphosphate-sugar epimerase
MERIAVFGASGFIGATLVEYLIESREAEVVPIIHSTGNAWRLARRGIELRAVDVVDAPAVRASLEGCTHVVNCALGDQRARTTGLKNLLRASQAANVRRFVHLSSVSVYGNQPLGDVVIEEAPPVRPLGDYGESKLEQDKAVAAAHRGGLSCALIAPPSIIGAYSSFGLRVIAAMRRGALALIDGGDLPCSLVDVYDVARATLLALRAESADATRIFVTNDEPTTWKDLVEVLAPFAGAAPAPPSFSRQEALSLSGPGPGRISPLRSVRTLLGQLASPASREVLVQDPLIKAIYRGIAERLPPTAEQRFRSFGSAQHSAPPAPVPSPYQDLLQVQLRARSFSCEKAKRVLGYEPQFGLRGSIDAFEAWYRVTLGWGSDAWSLASQL